MSVNSTIYIEKVHNRQFVQVPGSKLKGSYVKEAMQSRFNGCRDCVMDD